MKYVLAPPVLTEEGTPFWEITDTATDYPAATIHKDFPNAEREARGLLNRANDDAGLY